MTFEGVDVEAQPERRADLAAVGVPRVPATLVGDRVVHGWNPEALAELVGVRYRAPKKLTPAELGERMDLVLAATQRAVRQIPRAHLGMKYPGRDRTVHQLGFHVFRVAASFADTRERGHLDGAWFEENAPAGMDDGDAVARHGETVRARLAAFFTRPGWCDGEVDTYYGPQSAPEFMERTTWHVAQHLRQIYWFLDELGIEKDAPLTDADLEGLPFPREVWS